MNLDIYTTEMSKSIWDKSFFIDKIPGTKCVVDFGCANGAMVRYLAPLFPDITFVGYDINAELIHLAQHVTPFYSNVVFTNDLAIIAAWVNGTKNFTSDEICINFSSVLHEVYSSTGGIYKIKELIDMLKPKYITIRDMYCDDPVPFSHNTHIPIIKQLENNPDLDWYLHDYVANHGKVSDWRDLTHLLMKLQWTDNGWENEIKEDYFSWSINQFIKDIGDNYYTTFECYYQLPYLSEKWAIELNWFNPDIHTHAQFILRRMI